MLVTDFICFDDDSGVTKMITERSVLRRQRKTRQ